MDPKLVSVWEIKEGTVRSFQEAETGTVGKHYFNSAMNEVMGECIVSFPNLVEKFNSTIFRDIDLPDILLDHRIIILGTNSTAIKSQKRIKLTT